MIYGFYLLHYINYFVDNDVEESHLFCDNCAYKIKNNTLK